MEIIVGCPEGDRLMEVAGFTKALIMEEGINVGVYMVDKNISVSVLKGIRLDMQCAF
jgi:hypothetical protein